MFPMKTLILDASQNPAVLGLCAGTDILLEERVEGRSASLLPAIEKFCDVKKISFIAVGVGPGSYMGTRAAATIAKTLSYALDIPLIEFPSPLVFLPSKPGQYTIIGDAKMGQLYTMQFKVHPDEVKTLSSPSLIPQQEAPLDAIDLRNSPNPNLEWVAIYAYNQCVQENILDANSLRLTYLR